MSVRWNVTMVVTTHRGLGSFVKVFLNKHSPDWVAEVFFHVFYTFLPPSSFRLRAKHLLQVSGQDKIYSAPSQLPSVSVKTRKHLQCVESNISSSNQNKKHFGQHATSITQIVVASELQDMIAKKSQES